MNKILAIIVGVVAVVLAVWGVMEIAPPTPEPKPSVSSSQSFAGATPTPSMPVPDAAPLPQDTVQVPVVAEVSASATPSQTKQTPPAEQVPTAVTVNYTDAGFSPASATIRNGGTVTFKNDSSRAFRPASDPHPAHGGYPESGTCRGYSFDPCGAVPVGALWSFTFHTSGTWGYHDHMNASKKGTVVVR